MTLTWPWKRNFRTVQVIRKIPTVLNPKCTIIYYANKGVKIGVKSVFLNGNRHFLTHLIATWRFFYLKMAPEGSNWPHFQTGTFIFNPWNRSRFSDLSIPWARRVTSWDRSSLKALRIAVWIKIAVTTACFLTSTVRWLRRSNYCIDL